MARRASNLFACSLLALALSGLAGAHAADTTPATPEIFAPGAISGPSGVDCLTFAPDGATVYFDQQALWNGFIMESHRVGNGWSTPQIAPFSGQWQDHDPAMAPDGSFLVYTSNRADVAGGPAVRGGHLWRVDRRGDGWSAPVRLPDAVNDAASIYAPSVAANGDVYYQRRDEPEHEFHLYRTAWRDGRYQKPQRLALGDPAAHELDPAIAPDQSFMVFDANYAGKDKPDRLYLVFREGDDWSKPVDLGDAVNRYEPWGSHLGPDARTLYFTSNYMAKTSYPRSPAQARADLARMRAWDNGNNHIWRVSLAPWLDARRMP
ncbi:TolB family protein [Rhodanobacter umsongensis]|uniref:TolB family protein n=1 Tax=Rhodanobacter umsongensis TaxID=633153 RepID=A0ABW0JJX9_9GAMM